jgi:hypothetical protein
MIDERASGPAAYQMANFVCKSREEAAALSLSAAATAVKRPCVEVQSKTHFAFHRHIYRKCEFARAENVPTNGSGASNYAFHATSGQIKFSTGCICSEITDATRPFEWNTQEFLW